MWSTRQNDINFRSYSPSAVFQGITTLALYNVVQVILSLTVFIYRPFVFMNLYLWVKFSTYLYQLEPALPVYFELKLA